MQSELEQFERNNVWNLVPRPESSNVIGTKWIFKNKTDELGNITRNKARLVAQGYTQVEGVDFDETFALVARLESIRLLLAFACVLKIKLFQMDVKSVFLNGLLNEKVFVEQPKGFENPHFPNHVFKLKKALYGLKQAPRAWYDRLTTFLCDKGYKRGSVDKTLFIQKFKNGITIAQIYVDDIVFGSTSKQKLDEFIEYMSSEFEMSIVGELNYFLGLQVKQFDKGIFITQNKYAKNLVKRFGLDNKKHMKTPMGTNDKLSKDESGTPIEPTLYRSMIGALQYLALTRPDISFVVNKLSQFLHTPTINHWIVVKHLLRYLKGTHNLGLEFKPSQRLLIEGFSDADWASSLDDRKSTGGHCIFFGGNLLTWASKKQNVVSRSSAESECRS
ncbi:hypothetical protein DH2020_046458 [Rehmannia glutinosa]|uniref:Reverse transcriptase Ty1/copia-type domain-containing protein n=1 Tax=Rehmannia glutinosa TaxID=99300 RepID=A0ABR0UBR8_REHGL